jgi:hypothetical protein
MVTSELVERLLAHRRFPRLELDSADVEALVDHGRPKHYSDFVSEVFDLHGRIKGKRLVGEKSPGYVRHLPTLHELWPDARIVHLIRDGRDVALSVLEWKKRESTAGRFPTWEEDPITTAALWWEWHVRLGREAGAVLSPDRYHELHYESLVADSERECARLCTFLGVTYDEAMLRFHEGRTRPNPGRSAKAAWLPVTRGLRSWQEQMATAEVERFEAVAGPLLDELGYARSDNVTDREQLERAERLRKAFVDDVSARRRRVPAAWRKEAA